MSASSLGAAHGGVARVFDGNFRASVDRRTAPVGRALSRAGISPDLLTVIGIVFSVGAGVAVGYGALYLGFGLLLLGAVPDLLDGPVAKASQISSSRGAFFDSFADRVSDLAILGGLAIYFLSIHDELFAVLSFFAYGFASLISYQRAKAESLGLSGKGGVMERAERVLLLLVGLLVHPLLRLVLLLLLLGSMFTVIQRFVSIWRQASRRPDRVAALARITNLRRVNRRRRVRSRASLQRFLPGTGRPTFARRNSSGRKRA
ncbi:CDP-alcohol phosphatidyltransferase family protein [Ferrimicrobium acidiphilum]|uniref:CDP-alcohol phosphatidyltransferase family protein n=1 Tax=Ferrimicrobium acidiphilum TaxID=121039 RepID=UPI0023F03AF5|nr:CDP-alcohol phosphatidyltransferase family protein [Ferrimicrobium acidiphilum]